MVIYYSKNVNLCMFMMNQHILNSAEYSVQFTVPGILNIGCFQGKSDWYQLDKSLGVHQRILPRARNRSEFFWSINFHSAEGTNIDLLNFYFL